MCLQGDGESFFAVDSRRSLRDKKLFHLSHGASESKKTTADNNRDLAANLYGFGSDGGIAFVICLYVYRIFDFFPHDMIICLL